MNNRTLVTADKDTELFPEVDEIGTVIDSISRAEAHCGTKRLHPVIHLHLYNSRGELYLQHRAQWKTVQPDKWDTATGGHVDYGESIAEALEREVSEEIGLSANEYTPELIVRYIYESAIEKELVYVFKAVSDKQPSPSPTETQGGRFWSLREIEDNIGHNVFTPMFEKEYAAYLRPITPLEDSH